VYSERCRSLSQALKREHELKRWTRTDKEALIAAAIAVRVESVKKPAVKRLSKHDIQRRDRGDR